MAIKSESTRAEAVRRQYRDWLIPSSLFVGIDASIVIFAVSVDAPPKPLLVVTEGLATGSIGMFVLSLFWAFARLEAIEIREKKAQTDKVMFVLPCTGILLFFGSLTTLSFWRSLAFGFTTVGVLALVVLFLVLLLRYHEKKIYADFRAVELAADQIRTEILGESSTQEDKAKALRIFESAKAAAHKFDYWMKNNTPPPGLDDNYSLSNWLVEDRGARYVFRDYDIYKSLAKILEKMDNYTVAPLSKEEFMVKIAEADEKRRI